MTRSCVKKARFKQNLHLPEPRERIGSNPCGNGFWIQNARGFWQPVKISTRCEIFFVLLERTPRLKTKLSRSHFARPPNSPAPARRISYPRHTARLRRAQILRLLPTKFQFLTLRRIELRFQP